MSAGPIAMAPPSCCERTDASALMGAFRPLPTVPRAGALLRPAPAPALFSRARLCVSVPASAIEEDVARSAPQRVRAAGLALTGCADLYDHEPLPVKGEPAEKVLFPEAAASSLSRDQPRALVVAEAKAKEEAEAEAAVEAEAEAEAEVEAEAGAATVGERSGGSVMCRVVKVSRCRHGRDSFDVSTVPRPEPAHALKLARITLALLRTHAHVCDALMCDRLNFVQVELSSTANNGRLSTVLCAMMRELGTPVIGDRYTPDYSPFIQYGRSHWHTRCSALPPFQI